jgi:hypothetical protein
MAEPATIVGFGGYAMAGFCILGAAVMIGLLQALVLEDWEARRRDERAKREVDQLRGKQ